MTADLIRTRVQLPFSSAEGFAKFGHAWTDLWLRAGTSDEDVLREVWLEDCYRVRGLDLTARTTKPDATPTETTVIDIGACTGIFSALCLAFGAGRVIAVEPELENVTLLRKNLAQYKGRVHVVDRAVGDGLPVDLIGGTGIGHTEMTAHRGAGALLVDTHTLADIISMANGPTALLKMDVEGAEYDAIDACPSEVLARVENLAMEWHGPATAAHLDPTTIDVKYGQLMAKLAHTHAVTTFGNPNAGGMAFAHRYDL